MLISGNSIDLHTYQNVLPTSGKFWHDTRAPDSGDLSGSNVVKISDKVNSSWYLDQEVYNMKAYAKKLECKFDG